jgi:hypothetical protein
MLHMLLQLLGLDVVYGSLAYTYSIEYIRSMLNVQST